MKPETIQNLIEALDHCVTVFHSMAERGAYPLELSPTLLNLKPYGGANPFYKGKPGLNFAVTALAQARKELQ